MAFIEKKVQDLQKKKKKGKCNPESGRKAVNKQVSEYSQVLDLAEKDFKAAIISELKGLKAIIFKELKCDNNKSANRRNKFKII